MDGWLISACALLAGALWSEGPLLVGTTASILVAMSAWGAGFRRRQLVFVLAASMFALGASRGHSAIDAWRGAAVATSHDLPRPSRCSGRARIITSPSRTHGHMQWDATSEGLACDSGAVRAGATLHLYSERDDLARGDDVEVVADLAPPQRFRNDGGERGDGSAAERGLSLSGGTEDVRIVRAGRSILSSIDRLRARVRRILDASFDEATGGMVRAMVLGESDLAAEDDAAFRASGLSHLLAVSGMHLILVVLGVVGGVELLLVRISPGALPISAGRVSAAIALPVVWAYASFAGGGGSTLRAAWMMTVLLAVRALGRRADGARAFALSIVAMWATDPLVAFDLSFALSAAATGGLLAYGRPWGEALARRMPFPFGEPLAHALGTTLAASVACTPLILHLSPVLGVGGLFANLLAGPLGEGAALPLCLLHPLLGGWPAAQRGAALVATGALAVVRAIAGTFSSPTLGFALPPPTAAETAVLVIALAAPLFVASGARSARSARRTVWLGSAAAYLLFELHARRTGAPHGILRATFLDVGQGDATLIDFPDGSAMLIDGGGLVGSPQDTGLRVIAPVLAARRRSALDTVVLSHPHPDHVTGLASGLKAIHVGQFWDNGEGERRHQEGPYGSLLRDLTQQGVPRVHPKDLCGEHAIGGTLVEVLAPCPGADPDRGDNDNSLVLRITFGAHSFLFVGDAEGEEEQELLQGDKRLRADVLKVGHHGSRTSSSAALLNAVRPTFGVISSGIRNRFGHPHDEALNRLRAAGVTVFRTDVVGAVTATSDGSVLTVEALSL